MNLKKSWYEGDTWYGVEEGKGEEKKVFNCTLISAT